jgi:hypothetical protein
MLAEYVAGLFAEKALDGHCRNHPKPCPLARAEHLRALRRFQQDVGSLLHEICELADKVEKLAPQQ